MIDIQFALNNRTDMVIKIVEKPTQDLHDVDESDDLSVDDDHEMISYYFFIKSELDSSGNLQVQMIEDKDQI